jgi:hypothetical protein
LHQSEKLYIIVANAITASRESEGVFSMNDRISLVELATRLNRLSPDSCFSYERLWRAATSGTIPAEQIAGRTWTCDPADVPAILRRLRK